MDVWDQLFSLKSARVCFLRLQNRIVQLNETYQFSNASYPNRPHEKERQVGVVYHLPYPHRYRQKRRRAVYALRVGGPPGRCKCTKKRQFLNLKSSQLIRRTIILLRLTACRWPWQTQVPVDPASPRTTSMTTKRTAMLVRCNRKPRLLLLLIKARGGPAVRLKSIKRASQRYSSSGESLATLSTRWLL